MGKRMAKPKKSGIFLTIEGGEGSGKSTQIQLMASRLRHHGYQVVVTREPGGSPKADFIRELLLHKKMTGIEPLAELFLYEASRTQHIVDVVKPALALGRIVISDRFADSSLVYQGAARKLHSRIVENLNTLATGGLKPQLTFVFDLNPKIGLARIGSRGVLDRFERERLSFHQKVRKGYLQLIKKEPRRCFLIDASCSREVIHDSICQILRKKRII